MIGVLRGEVFANRRNWRTLHTNGDASIDDQQEREDRKQSNAKDDRNGNRHEKLDEEVGHQRTLGSDNMVIYDSLTDKPSGVLVLAEC